MKFALQRFRYAATGRWAVSIRTYTPIVMPFGFLTSIEREQSFNRTSITQAAVIAVGGELACALYLFIMQTVLLGLAPVLFEAFLQHVMQIGTLAMSLIS